MSDDTTSVLEEPHDDEEYDDDYRGPGRAIAIAAVVAIALGVGGYFAGHASAGGGPATLAEAVQQAQDGKLACGDTGGAAAAAGTPGAAGAAGAAGGPPGAGAGGAGGSAFLVRAVCGQGQGAGQGQAGGNRPGGGFAGGFGGGVAGQVQSIDSSTLTLNGRQGTVKLKLSSSTTVRKTSAGSLSDIKPGASVTVTGTGQNNENPATSITVLPASQ
jgi:hypothetical protein